jgi:hypothetical protein
VNVTVFDVDSWKAVESVGVNTPVTECEPEGRIVKGPTTTPPLTGTGLPRLVLPSLNCTVPTALNGATVAMGITKPPQPKGSGTWITARVVVVVADPGAGDGLGLDDGLGEGDELGLGDGDGLGDELGLDEGDGLGLGDDDGLGDELGPGDGLGDGLGLGDDDGPGLGDAAAPVL